MNKNPKNPVRKVCNRLRCTQRELARRMGVSFGLISQWATAEKIPLIHLAFICRISGFHPYELDDSFPTPEQVETARQYLNTLK